MATENFKNQYLSIQMSDLHKTCIFELSRKNFHLTDGKTEYNAKEEKNKIYLDVLQ